MKKECKVNEVIPESNFELKTPKWFVKIKDIESNSPNTPKDTKPRIEHLVEEDYVEKKVTFVNFFNLKKKGKRH
jgi:hypothetical protein